MREKSDMNKNTNPKLIEKTLEKLEPYEDLKIKNAIKEYHNEMDKKSGKDYTQCNRTGTPTTGII